MKKTVFTAVLFSLTSCQAAPDPQMSEAKSNERAGERLTMPGPAPTYFGYVSAIKNAGVMMRLGDEKAQIKFLFDPLYDEDYGTLQTLYESQRGLIVRGIGSYEDVTATFVSHAHGDHFSPSAFNHMMSAQSEMHVVAPSQAIDQMRSGSGWDPSFEERITEISLENGQEADVFELGGASIEAFRSPHTGWPDRHSEVHNITYRVSVPSEAGRNIRMMHFGDADPSPEHFAAQKDFFSSSRSGLAVVPYWYLRGDTSGTLIDQTFNAEVAVGVHVPFKRPKGLRELGYPFFYGNYSSVGIPETD